MINRTGFRHFSLAALAIAGLGFGAVALGKVIATDEYENGATRPVSVAILPSHVTLSKQRMIRQEAQVEESGNLEGPLTAAVASEFRSRGYGVSVVDIDAITTDPLLQEQVLDVNRRFDEFLTNIGSRLSKSKNVKAREYNAGDEARLLAAALGVDALVFTRMDIVAPSGGVRALNMGMGGETAMVSVTIVDGSSGDIEAFITLPTIKRSKMFGGHDDIVANPVEQMGNYASGTLDDMPDAAPELRAETDSDDVLSDLESLLDD